MFTFTPLQGAQSLSRISQSLLEFDGGVKVLVDVGWDERFDTAQLAAIEKNAPSLSFILLTHATISHLGAFAHCCKHIPYFSQIPVYATSPVIAFGRTLLHDFYSSNPLAATFIPSTASPEDDEAGDVTPTNILRPAPTLDEISKYFSLITPLKYSQPLQPSPSPFSAPLEGLTLTAYNSGHTLGGTIWHIVYGMESIVYAVDWNQARENVIAGAAWFGGVGGAEVIEQLRKPTALVCSSTGGDKVALTGGVRARDEALLSHAISTISRGGSVLIPTDSSARILELAWVLEKACQEGNAQAVLKDTKVYMASKSANATLRHARSLLEWMDDSIVREFEGEDDAAAKTHRRSGSKQVNGLMKQSRPFEFRHVKVIERQSQFDRMIKSQGPRVVLASDVGLDWGYARSTLLDFSQHAENLILLTERAVSDSNTASICDHLWKQFQDRQDGVALEKSLTGAPLEQIHGGSRAFEVLSHEKAPLDEQETQRYQQYVATKRQLQSALVNEEAAVEAEDQIEDDETSSSSEDSDDEQQGRALNVSAALGHATRGKDIMNEQDLGVSVLIRKPGAFDFDVRNKKGRNAVFPYTRSRRRADDFGDFIKPEDFLREEEKEEQDQRNVKGLGAVGQKRKWGDEKPVDNNSKRREADGQARQSTARPAADDSDESEESDVELQDESESVQGPSKIVITRKSIVLNARLAFVDFAGLHDQRSLQMLIPLIGPKKLILIGGTAQETSALYADCKALLGVKIVGAEDDSSAEILTPANGDAVEASVDTNAWIVKLSKSLVKTLRWQKVKNIGVFTLQGQLKPEPPELVDVEDDPKSKKQKVDTGVVRQTTPPPSNTIPILDIIPAALAASIRSVTQPIHVGDTRLADLRRLLNSKGHAAEFRGEGTILVDGLVAVRKMPNGRITIEGAPINNVSTVMNRMPDSFTQVKQQIYAGLAVVAAG